MVFLTMLIPATTYRVCDHKKVVLTQFFLKKGCISIVLWLLQRHVPSRFDCGKYALTSVQHT